MPKLTKQDQPYSPECDVSRKRRFHWNNGRKWISKHSSYGSNIYDEQRIEL